MLLKRFQYLRVYFILRPVCIPYEVLQGDRCYCSILVQAMGDKRQICLFFKSTVKRKPETYKYTCIPRHIYL